MATIVNNKRYLMDVVLIRLTLIFLLVFYHSFCIFSGGWAAPHEGLEQIEVYRWMALFTHDFRLEAMVFISGLLFGYTLRVHPERLSFQSCVVKKIKRILFPSLIFSIIYFLIFNDFTSAWHTIVYDVLNGCGHLWFLPMIFWCFVMCYVLEKYIPLSAKYILLLSILAKIAPLSIIPFGIREMTVYFTYFYIGFALMRGYLIKELKFTPLKFRWCILLIVLYAGLVVLGVDLKSLNPSGIFSKICVITANSLISLATSLSMIAVIYSIANYDNVKKSLEGKTTLVKLSGYCYGVYIYQQFVIKYLYYKTGITAVIDDVWLPWAVFAIALVMSLLLCHLTIKTKVGRYLIG